MFGSRKFRYAKRASISPRVTPASRVSPSHGVHTKHQDQMCFGNEHRALVTYLSLLHPSVGRLVGRSNLNWRSAVTSNNGASTNKIFAWIFGSYGTVKQHSSLRSSDARGEIGALLVSIRRPVFSCLSVGPIPTGGPQQLPTTVLATTRRVNAVSYTHLTLPTICSV